MKTQKSFGAAAILTLIIIVGIPLGYQSCSRTEPVKQTQGEYEGTIKIGHVVGVCMSPLFYAHDQGYFAAEGLKTELVYAPPGDAIALLDSGQIQFIQGPFTAVLRAVDQGSDFKIISGSGNGGLMCIAQPELGIKSIDDLAKYKGKKLKVGSNRINTLELTWYGLISDKGLSYADFDMHFFPDYFSMSAAFETKNIDVVTHVEPYATMLTDKHGGIRIGDSSQTWGDHPPDCVVTVRDDFLKSFPGTIKKYIRAILKADGEIKRDMNHAARVLVKGQYYKVDYDTLAAALPRQPPGVDLRPGVKAFEKALDDMIKLGYVKKRPTNLVDLALLDEVLQEQEGRR